MVPHLRPRQWYEDLYDRLTVDSGRQDTELFNKMYNEFFKIMPEEPRDSHRAVLHLNLLYSVFVGNDLLDRYDRRDDDIREMMAKDEAKDTQIAEARPTIEPQCQHCNQTGLRLTDKMLHHRGGFDDPEEVLFMLKCTKCEKNSAVWADGSPLEHRKTHCPKCKTVMDERDSRSNKAITTTYTCPSCSHRYKSKLDFTPKEDTVDPDLEADKVIYCLQDEKVRQELRDAKWRYEEMARLGKEWKEKEDNKHIYDAIAEMKKPKIAELVPLLSPELEKAGFVEPHLDKPEMGRDVFIGFSCLDSKSDRGDYDSQKTLKRLVDRVLQDTNWRLMSEGISYRLGYLSGRLRAYENDEELKKLVMNSKTFLRTVASKKTKEKEVGDSTTIIY